MNKKIEKISESLLNAALFAFITGGLPAEAVEQSCCAFLEKGEKELAEGKLSKAEDSFREAYRLAGLRSKDSPDSETCMFKLASALMLENKTAEAQTLYLKLLDAKKKRYGDKSKETVPVLFALGSIQEAAGNHTEAYSLYQKALQISEANYGPYSPAAAESLKGLGEAESGAGRKSESKKHYQKALSILMQEPGLEASTKLQGLIHNYNDLIGSQDDSSSRLIKDFNQDIFGDRNRQSKEAASPSKSEKSNAAESVWQREQSSSLKKERKSETDENTQIALRGPIAQSKEELAPSYKTVQDSIFEANRYKSGEENYERMIAADIKSLGPNHPAVANDLVGLSQLYLSEHKYKDAGLLLARALKIYEGSYGSDNILSIKTRTSLASAEFHRGNLDKSAEYYQQALAQGESALGPNNIETADILNRLAYYYYHQGNLQCARTFYEWALASTEGAVGAKDPMLAACLKDYAQLLRSLDKNDEATTLETRAARILSPDK